VPARRRSITAHKQQQQPQTTTTPTAFAQPKIGWLVSVRVVLTCDNMLLLLLLPVVGSCCRRRRRCRQLH
jgi:hypothetical protein